MNNFLLNKVFTEHHCYPEGEYVPEEQLPIIPGSILFQKKQDSVCVEIWGNRTLHTNYYIGVDWISKDKTIYVEPKLNKECKQTNYLEMLFSALNHSEVSKHIDKLFEIKFEEPEIQIDQKQDMLTPLLVVQFLKVVKEIVRKGLKKSYYKVENNLNGKVKGKIMVGQTIKQNLFKNKPLYTYCSYQEFGLNGLENRLLKKALVFIQRYLPTIKNVHSEKYTADIFSYVMPAFEQVSEEVSLHEVKHTIKNVFYKEYEEAIKLARLILQRFGYNITNTQSQTIKTPPFWIDMSKLFELYVLGLLKDRYREEIHFQFGEKYNQTTYGQPDFLLTIDGERAIIDAKYRPLYQDEKYDIDNIRQLSGYARDRGVLRKLGFLSDAEQKDNVAKCLIIFPDQSASEDLFNNPEKEISGFVNFYKRPVKLPTIEQKH